MYPVFCIKETTDVHLAYLAAGSKGFASGNSRPK